MRQISILEGWFGWWSLAWPMAISCFGEGKSFLNMPELGIPRVLIK